MSQTVVPVVGMHFRPPAKALLAHLHGDCPLRLEREPSNEYDPNAIKVLVKSADIMPEQHSSLEASAAGFGVRLETILEQAEWHLGYVAREFAETLAPHLDAGRTATAVLLFDGDGKPKARVTLI